MFLWRLGFVPIPNHQKIYKLTVLTGVNHGKQV